MLVIPAIDIRGGKCVRLVKGRIEEETIYSDHPAEMARRWEEQGAPMLHLVDLDGAFAGKPKNLETIREIRKAVSVPLQLGGGIRNLETIETLLGKGIDRVILGTAAVADPAMLVEAIALYQDKIAVGVDSKEGMVGTEGWVSHASRSVLDFAGELETTGVTRVIFTDISRDGTLSGPNLEGISRFLKAAPEMRVIVSGGISCRADIRALAALDYPNLEGVILGKSLYSKKIDLKEAIRLAGGTSC